MILTQLSTAPGAAASNPQQQGITAPVGSSPLRIFRRTLYFRISTGGAAESLDIDPDATLRATFRNLDFNALTVSEPSLRATVVSKSGGLVLTLDAPRRVLGITLPRTRAGSGSRLEFYRLDGDTPSGDPTVTVARQEELVLSESAFGFRGIPAGRSSRAAGSPGGIGIDDSISNHTIHSTSAQFNVDFTDARFLIRLKTSTGSSVSLSPSDLVSVQIRGYATNPRIGLAFPADPATAADPGAAAFFWRAAGEVGNGTPETEGIVDAGAAMAKELGRAVSRFIEAIVDAAPDEAPPPLLPSHLDVALVLESDAPCVLQPPSTGTAFRLEHRQVRESLADGEAKMVLRFPAGRATEQGFSLQVPAGISLTQATLTLDVSLPGDRSSAAGGDAAASNFDATVGVRAGGGKRVAQLVQLEEATSATGIAVSIMTLTAGTEASVELRNDAAGSPEGSVLADGLLTLDGPGRAGWALLRLSEPVVVSTAPHWLILTAPTGGIVWLTESGDRVRVLDATGRSSDVEGMKAMFDLRTRAGGSSASELPLSVIAGQQAVTLAEAGDGKYVADIAAAVQSAIAGSPAGSNVSVSLRLVAIGQGVVTAYPPRLVYS